MRRDTSVRFGLNRFRDYLEAPRVTEIAINGPDRVFIEAGGIWSPVACSVSESELLHLGTAIARLSDQEWNETHPLLAASVPMPAATAEGRGPEGELRFQLALPPAVPAGTVSITMRKPAPETRSLGDFARAGLFDRVRLVPHAGGDCDDQLQALLDAGHLEAFLKAAVLARKNIVIAGATGSGKTTFMKALVQEIPLTERLITIEDVRELTVPHANVVHLLYSRGGQSSSGVTARDLLEASLRMKPDRILLAELRGAECLYYIRSAVSGHPGSITSVHAGSPELAFEQMAIMIKDSAAGAFLDFAVIERLLRLSVDVIVQFQHAARERWISAIHFDPKKYGRR